MLDKVIRVFVSSTFKDFLQERDLLHSERIQGRLRQLCESNGFQFQLIDLRWGVSDEAGWDQRTEQLCLEEIRRCREVSPRPNFIGLVGQRYGWRPLPQKLSRSDWELATRVAGTDLSLFEEWYQPDANNVPFVYRLRARKNKEEKKPKKWAKIEKSLHDLLMRCLDKYPDRVSDAIKQADKSLTEKEIEYGAESAHQSNWQAFTYFREIAGTSRDCLDEPFVDRDENGEMVDPRSGDKLAALRTRLESSDKVTTHSYTAHATGDQVDVKYLNTLCDQIYIDLSSAIKEQLQDFHARDPLDLEISKHKEFAETRLHNFIPRTSNERRLVNYVRSPTQKSPLVVAASSGSGKTSMLARIQIVLKRRLPHHVIVTRFIGVSGNSASIRPLIRSIHEEVSRKLGIEPLADTFTNEPTRLLGETLRLGTEGRPLIILIDALDQLASDDHARSMNWLPVKLPPHAKFIATAMSTGPDNRASDVYEELQKKLPQRAIVSLNPMRELELIRAFSKYLGGVGRKVTKTQAKSIENAIAGCPRPLYVRVLAELARNWRSEHDPGALPTGIQEAVHAVLENLEQNTSHGKPIVVATLSKLAASRAGLTEPELVDLLGCDESVSEDFRDRSRKKYPTSREDLPPIIWSRLLLDLKLFLGQSNALGVSLLSFYHRQLEYAVKKRYSTALPKAALDLANYFESQMAMMPTEKVNTPNLRRAFELVWQLRKLASVESSQRIQSLLTNHIFVDEKAQSGLERDLLEDYYWHVTNKNLDSLVRFLADFLLSDAAGAERLAPEVIQSYLAYLRKIEGDVDRDRPNLYIALLKELVDRKLKPEASRETRRRIMRSKISLGEQLRRNGEYAQARELFKVVDSPSTILSKRDLAAGWYEKAYVEFLEDNYEVAIDYFDRSIKAAEEANDVVGAAIPYGPRQWATYFVDARVETLRLSIEHEKRVLISLRRHELIDPRAERWVRNTLAHLANLHYYLEDAEGMKPYVFELRNNPWIRDYEKTSPGVYMKEQHEARYLCAQHRYSQAAKTWRTMFEENRTKRNQQAAAWLMYDYGFAVERSGRKVLAAQIYFDGLNTPEQGACNAFWHSQIQVRLASMSQSVLSKANSGKKEYKSPLIEANN